MDIKRAIAIVLTIEENEASYEEKVYAIKLVSEMDTLNSITKKVILKAVNWLINNTFEFGIELQPTAYDVDKAGGIDG